MPKLIDLTGEIFGRLTVIKFSCIKNKSRWWLCSCTCGKEKEIPTDRLTDKKHGTKSCGCLAIERRREGVRNKIYCSTKLHYGEAAFKRLYNSYKRNAEKNGRLFELTKEHFKTLVTKSCFYCGAEPASFSIGKHLNGEFVYNGIDRIDNEKGYIINNVITCCKMCNHAKHTSSKEVFMEYLYRITRKYKDYV